MKLQFYTIYNGFGGYLVSKGGVSWTVVKNPLNGFMFADLEEAEHHAEHMLKGAWKNAFSRGTFCIATIVVEL